MEMAAKTTIKTYKKATKLPIKTPVKFIKQPEMTHTNHNFDCFNRSIPAIFSSGDTFEAYFQCKNVLWLLVVCVFFLQ